ncbi:MAG TPA: KH domain-containing protein [Actinomycetota bacterium]|nr:KH domain-containing protein [Actinomycetota bacterium]
MAEAQAGDGEQAAGIDTSAGTPSSDSASSDTDLVADTLGYLARSLVANVDDVRVERLESERGLVYRLHVNAEDMGRVIGRSGRIARSLRQVTRAAAARAGVHAIIEIAD